MHSMAHVLLSRCGRRGSGFFAFSGTFWAIRVRGSVTPVPASFGGGLPNGAIDLTPIGYGHVLVRPVALEG